MKITVFLQHHKIVPRKLLTFTTAFTHSSFTHEHNLPHKMSYERLEFLGDALLAFYVSAFIYEFYSLSEGDMSLLRAKHTNRQALANYACQLKLPSHLRCGKNASELVTNPSVQADLFEAFLAACYLDQGPLLVKKILDQTVYEGVRKTWCTSHKDAKTTLQEHLNVVVGPTLRYETHAQNQNYYSEVKFDQLTFGAGNGPTKKAAEQAAAQTALKRFTRAETCV